MAFDIQKMAPIGSVSQRGDIPVGFTYVTADTVTAATTAGYFNDARGKLAVNDLIWARCASASAASAANNRKFCVTAVPETGNVTVTDVT